MRFSEFNIKEEGENAPASPGYYVVGDSVAASLGSTPPWQSFAKPGAKSTNSVHRQAIDQIPPGSVVAMSLGAEDATSVDSVEEIAYRVSNLVSAAKGKGHQVVFILFPSNINANTQRNKEVRDALETLVSAQMFDMDVPRSSPANVASQIASSFKPSAGAVQKAVTPSTATTTTGQAAKQRISGGPANEANARASAEQYLGRKLSDLEWNWLIKATFAEASPNNKEQGWVMAAILNRVNKGSWGNNVISVLKAPVQFQSVTGTSKNNHRPSPNFVQGPPPKSLDSILSAAVNVLPTVPHNIVNFTAASRAAYGPGTNIGYRTKLLAKGGEVIGGTVFSA